MSNTQNQDHGLIFEGTVFARRIGDNTWFEIGNSTNLTIKSSFEEKKRISKKKGTHGQALDSILIPNPPEISWGLDTFNKHNFAMMLMGEAAEIEAKAIEVKDHKVIVEKNGWIDLPQANIDGATFKAKKAAGAGGGAAAELKAQDFELNENLGMVRFITDDVADGDEVTISFKTKATGGYYIDAGVLNQMSLELKMDAKNKITGKEGTLEVWNPVVSSNGDMDWLGDDFAKAGFGGTCVTPKGKPSAYRFSEFE